MKSRLIILGLLGLLLTAGCATSPSIRSRIPNKAFQDKNVVYVSDIQFIPKEVFTIISAQQQAIMQAKLVLPIEVWTAITDALSKIANAGTESYFKYRGNVVIVNREILVTGITNAVEVSKIIDYLSTMPCNSMVSGCDDQ